jgi:hypothetical protein
MEVRDAIIRMLKQLLNDMQMLTQQGAGYYSCVPIAKRYNKLLAQAKALFPGTSGLISTFDPIDEADPKDPSIKLKVVQGIRLEIGQLISLLESLPAGETGQIQSAGQGGGA